MISKIYSNFLFCGFCPPHRSTSCVHWRRHAHLLPSWPCRYIHQPLSLWLGVPAGSSCAALPGDGSGGESDAVTCPGATGLAVPLWGQQHHHGPSAAISVSSPQPGPEWKRQRQHSWNTNNHTSPVQQLQGTKPFHSLNFKFIFYFCCGENITNRS